MRPMLQNGCISIRCWGRSRFVTVALRKPSSHEVTADWGPVDAWAQGHQIAHHVDELVDLAWYALPVSPQRRRRADVLGRPARAHRVRHAGHGVHVGREDSLLKETTRAAKSLCEALTDRGR